MFGLMSEGRSMPGRFFQTLHIYDSVNYLDLPFLRLDYITRKEKINKQHVVSLGSAVVGAICGVVCGRSPQTTPHIPFSTTIPKDPTCYRYVIDC